MVKNTVKEYAKHRGITERSLRRYLAEGLIPEDAISKAGRVIKIDQAKADRFLDKNIVTRKELLGKSSPTKATPEEKTRTIEQAGTSGLGFHEARTLAQRYKAALLKIELDQKTGRLVDAEAVRVAAFNKGRAVRDSLLNIPDRISPILAAEKDQMKVADILTREIRTALEELSR